MTTLRTVLPALAASLLITASGCRTAGVGPLARPDPPSRAHLDAAQLLVEHNDNADRVKRLEAQPSVSSASRGSVGSLNGKLALERPRNFKLVLSTPMQNVADIGSNDEEFWFWAKDSEEKAVYFCRYDESGSSPLSTGLQPDWITEALGLRVYGDEEAARIKVTAGKAPGTLLLSLREKTPQGDVVFKDSVLNEASRRIMEHWVYAADHKTPLAHAVVSDYQAVADLEQPGEKVYLPRKVRLEWVQANKTLDVYLSRPRVNMAMTDAERRARFSEPKLKGFARVNLAERAGVAAGGPAADAAAESPTAVRETMPAPPPRVRLTNPAPLGLDGASAPARRRTAQAPARPYPASEGIDELVNPPVPTATDPLPQVAEYHSGWRNSMAPAVER